MMQQLLENEGIKVVNDKVLDFKNIFWDPTVEL
jgi:methylated-DNA-protein-cysteine methyltransferase-like protein